MADRSRWDLRDERIDRLTGLTIAYVQDMLRLGSESLSQHLDPTGAERLALARKLRRQSFRTARREARRELVGASISSISVEEAARVVATRPIPAEEMETLAADFFPDPAWPAVDMPPLIQEDFWSAFSGRPAAISEGH
jgi:crotonobetainyl-CoA:carnitine CoA-transferase CaiB-like acyl-CoA transferase